jgi:hypothetical protein
MTIQVTSTSKLVRLNGVPARIWEGYTQSGIKIHVFITRVAVNKDEDTKQFELELQQCSAPSGDVQGYPMSLIL